LGQRFFGGTSAINFFEFAYGCRPDDAVFVAATAAW
jgi:hypothetical protein